MLWKRSYHAPIASFIFYVPPKMLWKRSYHDHEEGGTPMTLQASCFSWYCFHILVILFWHCFQIHNTLLRNAPLILFASFFQSCIAMGYLPYSQCVSSHNRSSFPIFVNSIVGVNKSCEMISHKSFSCKNLFSSSKYETYFHKYLKINEIPWLLLE